MLFDFGNKTPITEGGEGVIYEYKSNYIAKVYKPSVDIMSKCRRAQDLIKTDLPIEVVKPIDTLEDRNGSFIGILMNKVEGEDIKRLSNKKFVISNNINTKDILSMLVKLWNVLKILHSKNIYIGDLNDQNVLFDIKSKNIYLIDVDSWSIGTEKCTVAMDTFKDPKLVLNNFNDKTDIYSFCVLAWKCLTRIHPFGGTTNPDMNILDRMSKGISIIDNTNVKIPKNIKQWNNLSPELINDFKNVFNNGCRDFGDSLVDMYNNLTYCDKHKDYYYAEYSICPMCDTSAKVSKKATSDGSVGGFKLLSMLNESNIKTVYSTGVYLDINNNIVNIKNNKTYNNTSLNYIFTEDDNVYITYGRDKMNININNSVSTVDIMYRSHPLYIDGYIYYISNTFEFCKSKIINECISSQKMQKCSTRSYFNVSDTGSYCVVNVYDKKLIINIDKYNYICNYNYDIINCEMHYDNYSDKWLIVTQDSSNVYHSIVLCKNKLIWKNDNITYGCSAYNIDFKHEIIYIPIDGSIRGLNINSLKYKDFVCDVITPDSKLILKKNTFIIVNSENIYKFYK